MKKPWSTRSNDILVLDYKKYTKLFLQVLNQKYRQRFPNEPLSFHIINRLSQDQLAVMFGNHKYYLTLTPVEGFGLPSLEAMAAGCAVIGFDGLGGRDYFKPNVNSFVVNYGQLDQLVTIIRAVKNNLEKTESVSKQGMIDAATFTKAKFEENWYQYLKNNVLATSSK